MQTLYEIVLETYHDWDKSNIYNLFTFLDEDEAEDFIKSEKFREYVKNYISNNVGYYGEDGHSIYLFKVEFEHSSVQKYAYERVITILYEKEIGDALD